MIHSTAGRSCTDDPLVRNTRAIEPFCACVLLLSEIVLAGCLAFCASFDEEKSANLTAIAGWRVIDE